MSGPALFELALICPAHRVDLLCDALQALDALSVSVEDADASGDAEQALFGEPGLAPPSGWQRSRLSALYRSVSVADDALRVLRGQDFFCDCTAVSVRELADQDWVRLTQSQFSPVEITPTFWIVPSWHEAPAQARKVIRLDPGLAFGTGTHPTTRMCLRWLAHRAESHAKLGRVLDYGCGSGILAVGAALHGATAIDAVDIDPDAVASTRLNARANQVELRAGLPDILTGVYETVLANILATPLRVLAPLLWSRVAPGGSLVLAGILSRQVNELQVAYAPHCVLTVSDQEDGWVCMTATR